MFRRLIMNVFYRFFYIIIGLIFAITIHAADHPLFPDNQLFDNGEFTRALPIISCDANDFQFSSVLEGHLITHSYIIENNGDAILQISEVKTGCGCSTVNYDAEIPPGKTGNLTLKIDTEGYGGKQYKEVIHIISNDPNTPDFELTARGQVNSLASVSPKGVSFKGKCTALHETIVTIIPNQNYSFEITGFDLGKLKDKVICTLTKKERSYLLSVQNNMKSPGRYWGKIVLNTDHKKSKQIDLWVSATLE